MLLRVTALLIMALTALAGRQGVDDPALRAAVERFFAMQQAEDVPGYLSLWSTTAERPQAAQLKYVFEQGDDRYSDVSIVRTIPAGEHVRVLVSATRDRTVSNSQPARPPYTVHTTSTWSLSYVRENGEWKLRREGPAADGLADSLIEATTAEQREQMLAAEPELVDDMLVTALARRASQAAQRQAYPAALATFDLVREIAHKIGNRKSEGEALQNIANTRYFQHDLQGALHAYEDRLTIERERTDKDDEAIAGALLGIATVKYSFAEYRPAMTNYREALTILERLGSTMQIAMTLVSTGNIQYLQGDFAGAIADFTRSREMHRTLANAAGEADALQGMARVLIAQGDYLAALDALSGVLADGKTRDDRRDQGEALLSIGDVQFRLGNLSASRSAFDEGRGHFDAAKDLANVGRAWQGIALVDLVSARFTASEDEYKKSSAACATAGDKECAAAATVGLAFALTQQDKFNEGIASYLQAIDQFGLLRRPEALARAEVGLSQALGGATLFVPAAEAAAHARRQAETLANDDLLWRALLAEATALRHLRNRDDAMRATDAAVATADRMLEIARVRPSTVVPRDASSAFAIRALLQAENGDAAGAFESVERMRVHDLRAVLTRNERDISRGMTEAERDDERTLAGEVASLYAQLSREKGLPKPDAERIAKIEKLVADAVQRRSAQQDRLFERLPELRIWRGLTAPATRTDVDRLLADRDTIIVELVVTDESELTVSARRGESGIEFRTYVEPASRRTIANRVAGMMQAPLLRDDKQWSANARELIPGLAAIFGTATRAIVIPHEMLWRVPFEALPTENGFLADTTIVTYAPSVTALVRAPQTTRTPDARTDRVELFAIGTPQLTSEATDRLTQTAPGWPLRAEADSHQELTAIADRVDWEKTVVVEGALATEAALREKAARADLIHISAPFRVNGASPLFSEMLLAPDAANDGSLEAREIMNLDLHAKAAILTDGAAIAMMDSADKAPIIAWAWRAAGVPSLLLRRWAGDDGPATTLLTELHARLRAGDTPAVALRAARAKVRATTPPSSPLAWAGWMLVTW
jgi:tetratricopeptide (TPR) repeat protein